MAGSRAAARVPRVPPGVNSTVMSFGQSARVVVGWIARPMSLFTGFRSGWLVTRWTVIPGVASHFQLSISVVTA